MEIDGNVVIMDEWEMFDAAMKEVRRHVQNKFTNRKAAYGLKGVGWNEGMVGALGEAAVAMYYNVYWSGSIGNLAASDVGRLQVRTRTEDWHNLILHDRDKDDDHFVQVYYDAPRFVIAGWIKAKDGKQKKFWKDPAGGRPAYFIPKEELNTDLSALNEIIYGVPAAP